MNSIAITRFADPDYKIPWGQTGVSWPLQTLWNICRQLAISGNCFQSLLASASPLGAFWAFFASRDLLQLVIFAEWGFLLKLEAVLRREEHVAMACGGKRMSLGWSCCKSFEWWHNQAVSHSQNQPRCHPLQVCLPQTILETSEGMTQSQGCA